ncbi:L-ascorbate metabolism protein UlaG (beta-lactamase superfamily) [Kribbella voronezhensis]|uniref:L-ascorbate metabolism protein UlaG (Beta-lactamase superfamily) n=1 Tax=Kribbella voronezhensis TaxID=2512212 RepID=A0A4R7TGW4_9ACTN|nr:MBL fold metallo-hydrolase [Kribbella voronezhensis]TDU90707.1 L-ascorbate metabolism protein UlaG (beta-lactamase superfamily) [Kribbella voronezhensis]
MKLTKYKHACVRLSKDGKDLLVDPGIWAEDEAFEGIDAILVTHEHFDHLDADRVRALDVPIWTNAGVAAELSKDGAELGDRVTVVSGGESFEAAGFQISAYGNDHAIILPELGVPCQNVGYLIEDAVYHPGDSFTKPDREVHTNLVPISGPWFSLPNAIDYVREVGAKQTIGIHDALLSEIGLTMGERWIGTQGNKPYVALKPAESVEIN